LRVLLSSRSPCVQVKTGLLWKKRYVVLSDGIMYTFKNVGQRKPEKKVRLR
jgi:hypothetical protein